MKYRSAINYPPVSWGKCISRWTGAWLAPQISVVSKRESRLRWRLARRLSIALPPCRQHLYSPRPISTNFYLTNFPVSAGIARFRVGSEAEDAKRGGRVVRGIRVVAMASLLGTSWSACKWITGIARGSRRRTDDWDGCSLDRFDHPCRWRLANDDLGNRHLRRVFPHLSNVCSKE